MTVKWRWLKLIIVNDHYRKEHTQRHTHTAVPHLEEPRQPLRSERDQLQTWLLVRPQTWHTPAWLQQCLQGWFIVSQLIQKQEKVARPSYGNKRNNVESDKTASAVLRGTACLSFPTLSCLLPQRDIFMFHRNFLAFSARLYACIEFYVTPSKQSYHCRSCFARWGLIFRLSQIALSRDNNRRLPPPEISPLNEHGSRTRSDGWVASIRSGQIGFPCASGSGGVVASDKRGAETRRQNQSGMESRQPRQGRCYECCLQMTPNSFVQKICL